ARELAPDEPATRPLLPRVVLVARMGVQAREPDVPLPSALRRRLHGPDAGLRLDRDEPGGVRRGPGGRQGDLHRGARARAGRRLPADALADVRAGVGPDRRRPRAPAPAPVDAAALPRGA